MNWKYLAISLIAVSLLSTVEGVHSEKETPLKLELWKDEITVKSGEKLVMNMTIENTSSEIIHTEYIRSRVEYDTLGGIVVNKTSMEWEKDIYPSEICEGLHRSDLPLYTLPGTYTIAIWIEYEGGKSEEVQLILHYRNFYIYIVLACIINLVILYAKKLYSKKKP